MDISVAAFLGEAPDPPIRLRQPTLVTSIAEFRSIFSAGGVLSDAVDGFFLNGGGRCHILNLGESPPPLVAADLAPLDALEEVGLVAAPGITDARSQTALIDHCEGRRDRIAILDAPEGADHAALSADPPPRSENGFAALYAPWIVIDDPADEAGVARPPSGHVAGVIARVDREQGVHRAPAGVGLHGARGLLRDFSAAERDALNASGVNLLRATSEDLVVWGARTRASNPEWRHIAVRRLAILIETSLRRGLGWATSRPDGEPLRADLRRATEGFLHGLWREGALRGDRSQDAFFVRLDESTTADDLSQGRLVAQVGFAPVRPAEFVVLRIPIRVSAP